MSVVGVHRFARPGIGSVNTYWIETQESLIVIDGQRELSAARAAKDEMSRLGQPIRAVFLTHPHPDHFGGIGVFAPEGSGIPLYGSAQTRESIRADTWGLVKASHEVVGADFPETVRLPDMILTDNQAIDVCGVRIVPAELGGGEAECMTVLHLPEHKALFAADAIQNGMTPFLTEGRSRGWLGQLHALRVRFPGLATIYPGHGDPGSADDLIERQIAYLETARDLVGRFQDPKEAADAIRQRYPGYVPVAAIPDLLERDAAALKAEMAAETVPTGPG